MTMNILSKVEILTKTQLSDSFGETCAMVNPDLEYQGCCGLSR